MKPFYLRFPAMVPAACLLLLGVAGCGQDSDPKPRTAKVAVRRLLANGTNTPVFVRVKMVNTNIPILAMMGGSTDSPNGVTETGAEVEFPHGQYSFRAWFPAVVASATPQAPAPQGTVHAELLVNGQVKATINLDAARPNFEQDTCSRTVSVLIM